jgi:hypothetical protein
VAEYTCDGARYRPQQQSSNQSSEQGDSGKDELPLTPNQANRYRESHTCQYGSGK